jgi:hypothetical protein
MLRWVTWQTAHLRMPRGDKVLAGDARLLRASTAERSPSGRAHEVEALAFALDAFGYQREGPTEIATELLRQEL